MNSTFRTKLFESCFPIMLIAGRRRQIWDCESHAHKKSFASGHTNNVFQARALPYTNNEKVLAKRDGCWLCVPFVAGVDCLCLLLSAADTAHTSCIADVLVGSWYNTRRLPNLELRITLYCCELMFGLVRQRGREGEREKETPMLVRVEDSLFVSDAVVVIYSRTCDGRCIPAAVFLFFRSVRNDDVLYVYSIYCSFFYAPPPPLSTSLCFSEHVVLWLVVLLH